MGLTKTPYLAGSSIGASDLSLFSVIKQLGLEGELQAEVKTWFARLGSPSGKQSSPNKRHSSPTKRQSSPKKRHSESSSPKKDAKGKEGKPAGKDVKKEKKSPGKSENQAIGSLFTEQWPETKMIFQSSRLREYS